MAFFGGGRSAAPTSGLLDIAGWELMSLNDAAQRVQQSGNSTLYGQWAALATSYVDRNQAAPPIDLPWYPGGGRDLGGCAEPLVVRLKAWANGRFVCAENGGASSLVANHGAAGPWETFMLVPNPDSSISLRSAANGRLLTAEGGGGAPLIANRITVGQWEKFDLVGA